MSNDEQWPPKSAYEALISSPSGRRKLADPLSVIGLSPSKQSKGTPSLLDRLRLARKNEDHVAKFHEEEEEDDEETLQLKLAAIEAKLKLKKLQKERKDENISITSSSTTYTNLSSVQVTSSPSKRRQWATEQRSPNRLLLGIDKGLKAADVSLRRAGTIPVQFVREPNCTASTTKRSVSTKRSSGSTRATKAAHLTKSFSERMSDIRDTERSRADKRDSALQARARSFKVDHAELTRYKEAAESQTRQVQRSTGPRKHTTSADSDTGLGTVRQTSSKSEIAATKNDQNGDATLFEGFSGLHLSSRTLPHSFLKRTLPSDQFHIYTIPDLLKDVTSPAFELPDETGNFVVFGVIASKSQPLDHKTKAEKATKASDQWQDKWEDGMQNKKKFMVFTITDLKWTIDMYLFDTALPRYYRLEKGAVIAILNPTIMPPKKGREDTGAFSLALHSGDDTLLEIGQSLHLGSCKSIRKDGKECGSWIDVSKTEICEFHLNMEIAKTQAKRMGVNTGTNGFGHGGPRNRANVFDPRLRADGPGMGRGLLPAKPGRGFDRFTGSHYYVGSSSSVASNAYQEAPRPRSDMSAARMLDLDLDDPFIAEVQFTRDREARAQKRLANQEQERQIAKQLADWDQGGSAGAQYMKRAADKSSQVRDRAGVIRPQPADGDNNRSKSGTQMNSSLTDLKSQLGRKRAAEDVHLSPVKKRTRFLTSRGVKEAGRESTGGARDAGKRTFEDDDDDLDIV